MRRLERLLRGVGYWMVYASEVMAQKRAEREMPEPTAEQQAAIEAMADRFAEQVGRQDQGRVEIVHIDAVGTLADNAARQQIRQYLSGELSPEDMN